MIEQDTIKLLRECDAGIRMGVTSIGEVIGHVKNETFCKLLADCKTAHEKLDAELQTALQRFGDEGKDPNPIARGMSWMKTNIMLGMEDSDTTVADLMTDGCNMGVKSLARYLNQYKAADEPTKDIAKRLIHLESQLAVDIRPYL